MEIQWKFHVASKRDPKLNELREKGVPSDAPQSETILFITASQKFVPIDSFCCHDTWNEKGRIFTRWSKATAIESTARGTKSRCLLSLLAVSDWGLDRTLSDALCLFVALFRGEPEGSKKPVRIIAVCISPVNQTADGAVGFREPTRP